MSVSYVVGIVPRPQIACDQCYISKYISHETGFTVIKTVRKNKRLRPWNNGMHCMSFIFLFQGTCDLDTAVGAQSRKRSYTNLTHNKTFASNLGINLSANLSFVPRKYFKIFFPIFPEHGDIYLSPICLIDICDGPNNRNGKGKIPQIYVNIIPYNTAMTSVWFA